MKIDWKRVHEENPDARFVAWDENGKCYSYTERPHPLEYGEWSNYDDSGNSHGLDAFIDQCPGAWDKTIIEFPGHYDDVKGTEYVGLVELSASLHAKAAEGKDAAKRARLVDAAIAAVDAFLKAHGKTLDAAGVEVVFNVREAV